MNFQPLIDNLPYILVSLGVVLWAAAKFVEAKAKAPEVDKWDSIAPTVTWASHKYSEAIDWLCAAGLMKLDGAKKLEELNKLTKKFEEDFSAGKYLEAVNGVVGYWTAAKNKVVNQITQAVSTPASVPKAGSHVAGASGAKG